MSYLALKTWYPKWIWILLGIGVLDALINIGVIVSEDLAHHEEVQLTFYIINEFTGSLTPILLIPGLFWFFEKVPLTWRSLIWYLLSTIIFGFIFTSIMYAARVPLYHMVGITRLDEIFNELHYRYLMEYFKQFFTFWLFYLVYWSIHQYMTNRDRLFRESELKRDLLKAQMVGLQRQLHPHFFFNTLNTISSMVYTNPSKADYLITRLSDFLRSVIQPRENILHTINEELILLNQYLDVMLSRYGDRLKIIEDIHPATKSEKIPVLLLQPLVENAILYSIDFTDHAEVHIKIHKSTKHLFIQITDNGPGITEGSLQKGTGLTTVSEKLQKIYGSDYQLSFQNATTHGLEVNITLPLSYQLFS